MKRLSAGSAGAWSIRTTRAAPGCSTSSARSSGGWPGRPRRRASIGSPHELALRADIALVACTELSMLPLPEIAGLRGGRYARPFGRRGHRQGQRRLIDGVRAEARAVRVPPPRLPARRDGRHRRASYGARCAAPMMRASTALAPESKRTTPDVPVKASGRFSISPPPITAVVRPRAWLMRKKVTRPAFSGNSNSSGILRLLWMAARGGSPGRPSRSAPGRNARPRPYRRRRRCPPGR